jgi:hypothetical protein
MENAGTINNSSNMPGGRVAAGLHQANESVPMSRLSNVNRPYLLSVVAILAAVLAGCAGMSAPPPPDVTKLEASGFKILLAQTTLQQERLKRLPTGKFTELQRTGLHFWVFPDTANNRLFLGSPKEFEAYQRLAGGNVPNATAQAAAQQAKDMSNYAKQDVAMTAASQRDMSDPYLNFNWPTLDELNW